MVQEYNYDSSEMNKAEQKRTQGKTKKRCMNNSRKRGQMDQEKNNERVGKKMDYQ